MKTSPRFRCSVPGQFDPVRAHARVAPPHWERKLGMMGLVIAVLTAGTPCTAAAEEAASYDVVVYGGTAAGVTAAVAAARHQMKVVLIEPGRHIGGMTSGGLGATDIGDADSIGGLSREFYQRVKAHYARPDAWKYETREQYRTHRFDPDADVMFHFEPKVAEKILNDMLSEAGVVVVRGQRLELKAGVVKQGAKIHEIVMESGLRFAGSVFIDATYEGDVMAKAGVQYRVGREANAEYNETHNGNQPWLMRRDKEPQKADVNRAIDPYVRPGDRASGLLFGVHLDGAGIEGAGDDRVQAYCYRLCTTNVPENRVPFPKPDGYDPARYELLLRHLTSERKLPEYQIAGTVEHPVLGNNLMAQPPTVIMPNRKSDSNNKGGISFDYLGGNYEYPDGDYAVRDRITRDHINWQQGLIWFVANDPRVPDKYRLPMREWGLAKDEFVDTGHWPHQLYVREARRMVGSYVMTQHDCLRQIDTPDSVGMGSYALDSHSTRRFIDENGNVRNEGKLVAPSVREPYPIAYGSLVPRKEQCSNLLVPVCLSATHLAYGSIRMEPVYMILAHSAGTAAAQAVKEKVAVQDIDRQRLRASLLAERQILKLEAPTPRTKARTAAAVKTVRPAMLANGSASAALPNIILCMTDDQGWGDVSYQGNPILKTPNLDAMAAAGVRFDRFYAAHFNCSPTRASLLTGRHPARFRAYSWGHDLPLAETTIAELVKQKGYTTGHFGKWHLGGIPNADGNTGRGVPESFDAAPRHPGNQGFDEWVSAGNWFDLDPPDGVFFHNGRSVGARRGGTSDLIVEDALAFIRRESAAGRPFLCVIWFPSPHSPFRSLPADKAPYAAYPETADFYGEVAAVDRAMGRLRDELQRIGARDNTVLWFNSDNGSDGGTAGPLAGMKGTLWEGGIRVPAVMEWPARLVRPLRTEVPVGTVDLLPTICDIIGLQLPAAHLVDGISLLPLLEGKMTARPQPLGFESVDPKNGSLLGSALVDNDWKLLRLGKPVPRGRAKEAGVLAAGVYLFNLKSDPAETKDLGRQEPEIRVRMLRQLDEFEASVARSAAAYPLVNAPDELRPVMLEGRKEIPNLVVDRLTFAMPGWSDFGSGRRHHIDGGLRLQPDWGKRMGIRQPLAYSSVWISFRFKLGESGRAVVELSALGLPSCSAIIDGNGVQLVGPSGNILASKVLSVSRSVWHAVTLETNQAEIVLQIENGGMLTVVVPPPALQGISGFGLAAEEGPVDLKDVIVTAGRTIPNWESKRALLR